MFARRQRNGAEHVIGGHDLIALLIAAGQSDRSPAFAVAVGDQENRRLVQFGFDRQVNSDVRVRLTGSRYSNSKSPAGTLYAGDRAGSRYWFVLENTAATSNAQASSGLINPQFRRSVTSYQLNPFVKVRGLELFGVIEQAKGIIAQKLGVGMDEAFARLRRHARNQNTTLTRTAQLVVSGDIDPEFFPVA